MFFLRLFKSVSFYTVLGCLSFLIWFNFTYSRWEEQKIFVWDVLCYYEYLPATFIRDDATLTFMDKETLTDGEVYSYQKLDDGTKVFKTTMGMAILYSPFFYVAHVYTQNEEGGIANGFTYHYQKAIFLSALFYLVFGLFFLRLLLLKFYNEWVSAGVIFIIVFGTNLYSYVTLDPGMSHAFNFSLIAVFLYYSIRWHEQQKLKYAILIGLIGGLIVLIRPVNILVFIFPILYNLYNLKEIKIRALFFWEKRTHLLLIAGLIFLCCLPQMIYWKSTTGNFLFNSYVGERFYFDRPHILEGLFSYRKGWLLYTPIMTLSLIGMYALYKAQRQMFLPVLVFTVIFIYVVFSWWAWWYGGSFGARPFIDFYALFALSIAAFLQYIYDKRMLVISHILSPTLLFLVFLNLYQARQYKYSSIHYDAMTKDAYWITFMRMDCPDWPAIESALKAPDYDKARKGEDEYTFSPF